ncbi:MAG TPA: LysR family transcriptional regulator [Serratia grimesii]|uniref:LysR family transcriptional regulator n=2 Tax=Enterobacterales TaxID=91347 RepID=A0A9C7QWX9_9GAMM|nr:LysR family transcriptional regulator [Serratia grimesii]CAI0844470.1 D-malate degradation protein R [Serratia grimesii]CAI0845005.1 D-malate degradation protein R [Serratia grimesii]CAI0930389.1 D-malate degradation protein R [Serratia grimesii]CAI2430457.1 D-malate degradation protein R [Serratia grimesii]CAI2790465.1 D-malate degradation protein R [Serratia grimesii]
MDRWTEYELFVKTAELGSISKAAEALSLSNAAASRHLVALEDRLGVRLIERSTRRLFVTEVGRQFYENAKVALSAMQNATDAVTASKDQPAGVLRVTGSLSLCLQLIFPLIPKFKQLYPDVRLDIVAENRYYDIIDDNIDIAIRTRENEPDTSLIVRRLTETKRVLAATPEYLKHHGYPNHPLELAEHQLLLYSYANDPYKMVFQRGDESVTTFLTPYVEANDGFLIRRAALQNLGILAQPTYVIHEDLQSGRLIPVLSDWELPKLAVNMVYTSRLHLPAKTRVFIDFLINELQP